MDEHKPQEQASEKVPARRKSGRMHGWRASILACVICILVTALVTSMIFVGKFGGSSNYKLALKFAQVKQVVCEVKLFLKLGNGLSHFVYCVNKYVQNLSLVGILIELKH